MGGPFNREVHIGLGRVKDCFYNKCCSVTTTEKIHALVGSPILLRLWNDIYLILTSMTLNLLFHIKRIC